MIGTGASALVLTFAGIWYDRFGARLVSIGAAAGLSSALILVSYSPELVKTLSTWVPVQDSVLAFVVISFAFFAIRFTGQGVLTMASRNLMMKWFDQWRGRANMISSIFVSLGFSIAPLLLSGLIDEYHWDGAWRVMALIIACFIIFAFIFYRDNPEDCGLIPDGRLLKSRRNQAKNFQTRRQYTLKEAQKTRALWVFSGIFAFYSFFITGFTFNVISIFASFHYSEQKALAIFIPTSVIAITVSTIANLVSDYTRLQNLLFIMLAGAFMSSGGLIALGSSLGYVLFIIGNGLMAGIFTVLVSVTWPRFYGRKHLGAISGFSSSFIVMASSLGPLYFSKIFTLTGHYTVAGLIGMVIVTLLFIASFKAKNPQ